MAQALFDALSAEDDDIFQCGRCGKQFTSLPAFVSHKQSRCAPPPILAQNQLRSIPMTNTNNNVAAAVGTQTPLLTQNISYTNATQPIKREPINNDYTTSQQTTCTQYDLQNSPVKQSPFLSQVVSTVPNVTSTGANSLAFTNSQVVKQEIQSQDVQSIVPQQQHHQQEQLTSTALTPRTNGKMYKKQTVNAVTLDADRLNNKATTQKAAHKVAKPKKIITILPSVEQQDLILQQKLKSHHTEDILLKDDCDIVQSCISGKKKLHCEVCDKHFAKNVDLQQHVRSHTKEKPFQCIVCGRAFALKSNVKKHMSTHKNSPVKQSPFLSQVVSTVPNVTSTGANSLAFTNSQVVKQEIQSQDVQSTLNAVTLDADRLNNKATTQKAAHTVTQPGNIVIILPSVEQEALILQQKKHLMLQQKLKSHHTEDFLLKDDCDIGQSCISDKKNLRCEVCDKHFTKNFNLQQHVRSHTGEKPFQCIVCGRAFAQKYNIKKHMSTHKVWPSGMGIILPRQPSGSDDEGGDDDDDEDSSLPIPDQPPPPPQPPPPSTILDAPNDKEQRLNVVVSFLCQYCPEKFKSHYQLKSHMVRHKSEQVYKCVVKSCGQTFKELEAFLSHTKSHKEDMTYQCQVCSKHFTTLYELDVHENTHSRNGPSRNFQCTKCLYRYSTPEGLEHHLLISSHDFSCPHCKKIFPCGRNLRRHLPIHGRIGCKKKLNRPDKLKACIITHSGVKPFKCKECGKCFTGRSHLIEHERGHKGDYKFKCQKCGRGFFRPNRCHNHKCKRRKLGHPPKHMITVISDTNKPTGENEQTPCKRGRPLGRTAAKAQILPQI